MGKAGTIRIGVGGWVYEPWRGSFYPEGLVQKEELGFASRRLTAIEINGTFYRTPGPDTFAKWHDETPDGFVFAVKAPRYATTRRELATAGESVERFCTGGVLALKDKLGPINWQLAPTKKLDLDDVAAFLALLPKSVAGRRLRHALEVRHPSFQDPAFVALAREHEVAIVVAGDSQHPRIDEPTAPFTYARIMGTAEGEPLGYPAADLDRWAAWARAHAAGSPPRDVFLFVISGHKVANPKAAQALIERIA
ncbi:MAG: DUF72 domain-containing protein [Geminicoccaceae bacterium]